MTAVLNLAPSVAIPNTPEVNGGAAKTEICPTATRSSCVARDGEDRRNQSEAREAAERFRTIQEGATHLHANRSNRRRVAALSSGLGQEDARGVNVDN